jgi:hypothetical protein
MGRSAEKTRIAARIGRGMGAGEYLTAETQRVQRAKGFNADFDQKQRFRPMFIGV